MNPDESAGAIARPNTRQWALKHTDDNQPPTQTENNQGETEVFIHNTSRPDETDETLDTPTQDRTQQTHTIDDRTGPHTVPPQEYRRMFDNYMNALSPNGAPTHRPQRHQEQDSARRPTRPEPNGPDHIDKTEVDKLVEALAQLTTRPQHNSAIKGLNFPPPKFGGEQSEFFSAWLRDYDDYAACMGWTDEHKLRGLSMVLSGRAKQIFQDIPPNTKSTWQAAIHELRQKYNEGSPSSMTNFTLLERVQTRRDR